MEVFIDLKTCEDRSYSIYIDPIQSIRLSSKTAIVTNPKVAGLHLKYLLNKIEAPELYIITLPDGEDYKNQETLDFLLDRLFDHKLDRKSVLIAFGGGVIGDMTGFAASVFQRGIDFIQIPTTLLSQVDASVGGKTGINNRFGKNLIGAFHQPKAVYIDTHFLQTLPQREFSAGVAEIVKMAVVFDKDFFEWLMKNDLKEEDNLKYAIKRSVELKAAIVAKDEREGGVRASLNYGHTFAHVIENETGYKRFLHGEAVAIGMVMANELAVKTGLLSREDAEKIKNLLQRYNLPVCYEVEDPEDFYEHFFLDKKTQNDTIKFVLPKDIGDFVITDTIKKDQIIDVLREFERC
ncbi:3-dehydroquinate synthase [Nitratiruptor sp. SB155-2]|uniref:3-dehydroquinate synthase n=1 Tax=Nitratiruptor sp. (strain SB155-2) TaxID=387092 RepID=AROB_NITSB|nr:3-dehydroquinate synthase [Nitratiruptor sp. SB155-2]A6Q3Y3.1 RecName: Full=3-dehydroquinate synthase; Short=DHQS [Nitratiruptor sp. SB155-2]BAF70192.1 3-dehydroquinate synthase [Nitratiruptor sp. SB155-2]